MRVGFVAASLAAHLGVVGIALYTAAKVPPASPQRRDTPAPSGLVSVELDDAAEQATAPQREALQLTPPVEPATSKPVPDDEPPALKRTSHQSSDEAAVLSKQPSVVPNAPTNALPRRSRPVTHTSTSEQPKQPAQVNEDQGGDWLSIDQQLPEPKVEPTAVQAPQRDELVERLLAKEREKQRVKQREELERSQTVARTEAQPRPVAPSDEGGGSNYNSADPWVELTRWLPRAASSDQAWEQLEADTRFDVQVRVRAASEAPIEVSAVGAVPGVVLRLLNTTAHMMRRGQFEGGKPFERRFALRIRLSQTEGRELWIAHTTPDPPKPGVGSFVSPSGRRFDVWVAAEP